MDDRLPRGREGPGRQNPAYSATRLPLCRAPPHAARRPHLPPDPLPAPPRRAPRRRPAIPRPRAGARGITLPVPPAGRIGPEGGRVEVPAPGREEDGSREEARWTPTIWTTYCRAR
ncbi:hypothetical protein GCM10027160_36270 [Streptomyces calidiresistens]